MDSNPPTAADYAAAQTARQDGQSLARRVAELEERIKALEWAIVILLPDAL